MAVRARRNDGPEAWYVLPLGCFTLFGFAVAQPLFDLLGRDPLFLLEHEAGWRELLWLVGLSWIAPGLGAGILLCLARVVSTRLARALFVLLVLACVAMMVSPLVATLTPGWPWMAVALATTAGALVAVLCWRSRALRGGLAVGAVAPVLFSLLFVLRPGIRGVANPPRPPGALELRSSGDMRSLILVVLDEVPVSSLLSSMDTIDAARFPNLAAFRDDSIWYRNCATVSGATERSVPAILTGRYVRGTATPDLEHYPENLITLLAHDMLVVAQEGVTHLSPPEFKRRDPTSRAHRMDLLLSDSGVLLLHRILPPKWARRVPQVDSGWAGFGRAQDARGGRPGKFLDWVQRLQRGFEPTLGVLHLVFPHNPYVYFPDGTQYSDRSSEPFKYGGRWTEDLHPVEQSWQRSLLQLEAADHLIGVLVERLRELELYDDAVIAITADHGASFLPGDFFRRISESNAPDLVAVPWFLKLPGGARAGETDDRLVSTVDILPTLAAAAGFELPWEVDGRSYLSPTEPAREFALFFDIDEPEVERRIMPADLARQGETLQRKTSLFGAAPTGTSVGPYASLVGRPLGELEIAEPSEHSVRVLPAARGGRAFVAAELQGVVLAPRPMDGPVDLALALRDSIVAVTRSVTHGERVRAADWLALLPQPRARQGLAGLQIYSVDASSRLHLLGRSDAGASILGKRLGVRDVGGVELLGIYRDAGRHGRLQRWTSAQASLSVSLLEGEQPRRLRIEIARVASPGTEIVLRAAGRVLFQGTIDEEGWRREFPLDALPPGMTRLLVELGCGQTVEDASGRQRGILLSGVWLDD